MQVAGIKYEWVTRKARPYKKYEQVYMASVKKITLKTEVLDLVDKRIENPEGVWCRILAVFIHDEQFGKWITPPVAFGIALEPLERPF